MRGLAVLVGLAVLMAAAPQSLNEREATVGMRARIDQLVLPGPELVAKPVTPEAPVVLRILATWPHGTALRYDLEYYGLEPGRHDLAQYLARKDGTAAADLPAIPVEIKAVLPPGQVEPGELATRAPPALGGYGRLLVAVGITWVAGLLVIVFARRWRRRSGVLGPGRLSLADRLRPMVEAAAQDRLDEAGKASLERLLLAYWRGRLGLEGRKADQALFALREHAEAGALLRELESWLHRPGPRGTVDVAALLAPYRNVAADEVEPAGTGLARGAG